MKIISQHYAAPHMPGPKPSSFSGRSFADELTAANVRSAVQDPRQAVGFSEVGILGRRMPEPLSRVQNNGHYVHSAKRASAHESVISEKHLAPFRVAHPSHGSKGNSFVLEGKPMGIVFPKASGFRAVPEFAPPLQRSMPRSDQPKYFGLFEKRPQMEFRRLRMRDGKQETKKTQGSLHIEEIGGSILVISCPADSDLGSRDILYILAEMTSRYGFRYENIIHNGSLL